ncbi:MAG: hypothetical protein RR063_08020 [Anaerovoracaceae bacterium]
MSIINAPLFFQGNKAKELNDKIFKNTGCFIFLMIKEFPFTVCCENYRQALYSLIIDSYVLFHDYGRNFLIAFAKVSNTVVPSILNDLIKYRILLTHSQFEPEIQTMNSFVRLITAKSMLSIEEFYEKLSNANDNDFKAAYEAIKAELDTFYNALSSVSTSSIKTSFCNYYPWNNNLNAFYLSLNEALIKTVLQAESGKERPTYTRGNVTYCQNGNVRIQSFKVVQNSIITKYNNNQYSTPDEIYPDFRNQVISAVNPPQQSSALLFNHII